MKYQNLISKSFVELAFGSVLALAPAHAPAHAMMGGETGGGGDAVILPDDTVVLADQFYRPSTSTSPEDIPGSVPILLPDELNNELKRISSFSRVYFCDKRQKFGVLEKAIFGENVRYFFVPTIPDIPECINNEASYQVPSGGHVSPIGCSIGANTYLQKEMFLKMSVREQALLIAHERIRTLPAQPGLKVTATITQGLRILLDFRNRQIQGERPLMDNISEKMVLNMREAGRLISSCPNDSNILDVILHPAGGLIEFDLKGAAHSSYLGVGSRIPAFCTLGENTVILNTAIWGKNATADCSFEGRAKILDSEIVFEFVNDLHIGFGAVIENSALSVGQLTIGRMGVISGIRIEDRPWSNVSPGDDRSKAFNSRVSINVGDYSKLLNGGDVLETNGRLHFTLFDEQIQNLVFASNAIFDFGGKNLCASATSNVSRISVKGKNTISNIDDLRRLCVERHK